MTITRVQTADAELLRSFAERTFRVAYEANNNPHDFKAYCEKYFSLEQIKAEIAHPFSAFWFAYIGEQLVAYLKLNFDHHPPELNSRHTVQVERIYVEQAMQGRGIGEKVLRFAHEQAAIAGAEWLWLSVWQANPPAVRFYERCGYQIFGTETFVVGTDPQLDWLMKKEVSLMRNEE
ncbi:MAG: GNAT family N-acetyltransferase [Lewinellaceae bacterium]|nr:GNAT family N-acetyltransferase [Lewinellaceae bacterium]